MKILFFLFAFCSGLEASDLLVEKKVFTLGQYQTVQGEIIKNVKIGYETYGTLNQDKSNAILITHHFSGTSHAAGKYQLSDQSVGYWDSIIGPGKAIDTNTYFVISSDTLVNLSPFSPTTTTTGPASQNPKTKKPYALAFPMVQVEDFVHVQKKLIDSLGIKKLVMVAGPSGGAAQAMQWGASYPDSVDKILSVIGPGLSMPDYTVALLNLWSMPIKLDPLWRKGNYYGKKAPLMGVAESLKMITFSALSFEWAEEFKREKDGALYKIEAFLDERGKARAASVDANSLLYTAKAIQSFDVENKVGSIKAKVLFLPVSTDLIFPPGLSHKAAKILCDKNIKSSVHILESKGGHLDGLFKIQEASEVIQNFLKDKISYCP